MRRIGERGDGQWERISWDAALDEMADRMAAIRARYGAPALVGAVSGAAFSRGSHHGVADAIDRFAELDD
jgi:anaerobic selenocysteine-containing dehydrogenase